MVDNTWLISKSEHDNYKCFENVEQIIDLNSACMTFASMEWHFACNIAMSSGKHVHEMYQEQNRHDKDII